MCNTAFVCYCSGCHLCQGITRTQRHIVINQANSWFTHSTASAMPEIFEDYLFDAENTISPALHAFNLYVGATLDIITRDVKIMIVIQ